MNAKHVSMRDDLECCMLDKDSSTDAMKYDLDA